MIIEMGNSLPLPTRILMNFSGFIQNRWMLFVIFAVTAVFIIRKAKLNKITKKTADRFKLKIPVFGKLIKNVELARFSRVLSMLLGNGVPVLYSLKLVSGIIDNEVIKDEIGRIFGCVKSGSALSAAMRRNTSFPVFMINMTAAGEKGGFLEKALMKTACNYEKEIDKMSRRLLTILEPSIILIMGLVVGFIVFSMLLPVFQISLTVQ
jgi:type II secretory pathway component PulF